MVIQKLKPTNINALSVASVPKQKFPNQESNAVNDLVAGLMQNEAPPFLQNNNPESLELQTADVICATLRAANPPDWEAARENFDIAHFAETTPDQLRKSMNL